MDTKLKKFLDNSKIKYQLHEHKKVYTAFNEAETLASPSRVRSGQHIKPKEVAKTVLVKADKGFALVVIPAQKYVDFGKVKKTLKAKKVSMAKEADIKKILKAKIGLIHPFGNLYNLPVLLDNALARGKKLITSPGSYTKSLELKTSDFMKLVEPSKGAFSK